VEELAVRQRVLDAEPREGRAVEDARAPEAEVREDAAVGVDEAEQRAVGELRGRHLAGGVEARLGMLTAAGDPAQPERRGIAFRVREAVGREVAARSPVAQPRVRPALGGAREEFPLGLGDERVVEQHQRRDALGPVAECFAVGDEVLGLDVVEEVRAELGRLQEEGRGLLEGVRFEGVGLIGANEPTIAGLLQIGHSGCVPARRPGMGTMASLCGEPRGGRPRPRGRCARGRASCARSPSRRSARPRGFRARPLPQQLVLHRELADATLRSIELMREPVVRAVL